MEQIGNLAERTQRFIANMVADSKYIHTARTAGFVQYRNPNLISRSGSVRLLDLGSAGRIERDTHSQKCLEDVGIREYIGVDLAGACERGHDFRPRESMDGYSIWNRETGKDEQYKEQVKLEDRIRIKSINGEILEVLRSLPDNYANAHITGLDPVVFSLPLDWNTAVLSELRRVVPAKGFIFTDPFYAEDVLAEHSPDFREFKRLWSEVYPGGYCVKRDPEKERLAISTLEKYKCREDDLFRDEIPEDPDARFEDVNIPGAIANYVVDMPELQLRAYTDELRAMTTPIVLINTKKDSENSP